MGRRARISDALTAAVVRSILRGNTRFHAFAMRGVPKGTWNGWVTRGNKERKEIEAGEREEDTVYTRLVSELDRADAQLHDKCITNVLESDDPRVVWDFMKRKWNKHYTANPNAVIDGETGEEYNVDAGELLLARLRALKDEEGE